MIFKSFYLAYIYDLKTKKFFAISNNGKELFKIKNFLEALYAQIQRC